MYDFDEIIDRSGSGCLKLEQLDEVFGRNDLLPMWIADMDFEPAEPIKAALKDHIDKYPLGYSIPPEEYYDNFIAWEKKYHGYEVKREWICFGCGIVGAFNLVTLMLTKPGDAVMTVTPCYYPMQNAATNNDRKLVTCEMDRNGMVYTLDLEKFEKTITERVFSDDPTTRTIVYKAPFFKKCREDDYKEAWEMLEKREIDQLKEG